LRSEINQILVIRFSAIGDVLLTTPVLRQLKAHFPHAQISFLVKKAYLPLLEADPFIDQLIPFTGDLSLTINDLKKVPFDYVIDLQANIKSLRIRRALNSGSSRVNKWNLTKWLMVNFKKKTSVPHIGLRYLESLQPLGIFSTDSQPHLFIFPESESRAIQLIQPLFSQPFYGLVLGATYTTKRWIDEYFIDFINLMAMPLVLLGGQSEFNLAEKITKSTTVPIINAVAQTDFLTSAAIIKQCSFLVTHDTGMMHMADAFGIPCAIIWGNTVPEFGFEPIHTKHINLQVNDLACRPCSKIGFQACPKKHFDCMKKQSPQWVAKNIKQWLINSTLWKQLSGDISNFADEVEIF
jgi:ADP-heptose:LPS heptosyltransferase